MTESIDLRSSYLVGDRWRDVEAGHRAGCQPIFVDYGYRERQPDGPFWRVHSLGEAANWILTNRANGVTATCLIKFPTYA